MSQPADDPSAPFPRIVVLLVGMAAFVVAAAGLKAIGSFFSPVFLALTLVICVHPLLAGMQRRGVPSWLAVTLSLLVLYLVLIVLIAALALSAAQFAGALPHYSTEFTSLVTSAADELKRFGVTSTQLQGALTSIDPSTVFGLVSDVLGAVTGTLTGLALLVTTVLFMGADAASFPRRIAAIAPDRPDLVASLQRFARGVRSYWLVSTVFGLIVAALDVGALYWIGVPLALVWGVLSFLTNYIPNIGFVLGVIPPALLALLDGGWQPMVAVLVVYSVLNIVIQSIIQPRFTGNAVGLTVTGSFLSLIFWGYVLGPLGALLALPMSLLVKSLLVDADPSLRWVNALMSSKADLDPEPDPG